MKFQNNDNVIGILGLGITGKAVYDFLYKNGENIICFDDNKTATGEFILAYPQANIVSIEDPAWRVLKKIIVSPGISPFHEIFQIAKQYGIEILSDIDLLYEANESANYIGITGTNGKSTTCALTRHIIINSQINYELCGNIGIPALQNTESKGYVLELSSYQIDLLKYTKLNIAALLNITPDHLDRYKTLNNYIQSKTAIFSHLNKDGIAILGADNKITNNIINSDSIKNTKITFSARNVQKKGVAIISNKIIDSIYDEVKIDLTPNAYMNGEHNMQNIAASYAICRVLGIDPEKIIEGINSFKGLKHRMQFVGKVENISFFNDSKATNVDAASKSISSLNNIYWLAGGIAKEDTLLEIEPYLARINKAYIFGKDKTIFANNLQGKIKFLLVENLEEAFNNAVLDAMKDQNSSKNILLAPAAASTDQFKNFEARGDKFIELFNNLKN